MQTEKRGNGSTANRGQISPPANPPQKNAVDSDGAPAINGLDLASARLTQDFGTLGGVKKLLTTVPARKPSRQEFFRAHPDESYRMPAAVLELKEERESYLLASNVWPAMPGEWSPRELVTAINRQGVVFVWAVPLPGEDGRSNPWWESAREAAQRARDHWTRMVANMALGAYEIYQPEADLPDPDWPTEDFQTLLGIAYKDRYITDLDHAVLRRLRGEL
jgi:hypothetical protein